MKVKEKGGGIGRSRIKVSLCHIILEKSTQKRWVVVCRGGRVFFLMISAQCVMCSLEGYYSAGIFE